MLIEKNILFNYKVLKFMLFSSLSSLAPRIISKQEFSDKSGHKILDISP